MYVTLKIQFKDLNQKKKNKKFLKRLVKKMYIYYIVRVCYILSIKALAGSI